MKNYLETWDFMRLLRLALGIFIIVQGSVAKDWLFVAAGVFVAALRVVIYLFAKATDI